MVSRSGKNVNRSYSVFKTKTSRDVALECIQRHDATLKEHEVRYNELENSIKVQGKVSKIKSNINALKKPNMPYD
jgi:hypothetical protein